MEPCMNAQKWRRYVLFFLIIFDLLNPAFCVTHYSIPEEMEVGSVVANIATDLGLDIQSLTKRKMRLDVIANKKYLDVNKETGELFIVERIDREYLCPSKTTNSCFLKLDATIEHPIRMFNIELEILDINDNAPHFRRDVMHLDISESTPAGERFSLNNAVDSDIGSNSIKTYYLSESDHFTIEIQSGRDGSKLADLVLKKALDREEQAVHNLILTAVDGGVPSRSGTANIIVQVLDTNDNAPQFDKDSYTVHLSENFPVGSLVVKLNATDLDEGSNSEITYTFSLYTSEKTQETFNLNSETGEIRVKEMINYEDFKIYDMEIIATDKGSISLSGKCKLAILITDMNDNHPEISIKSFSGPVKEDVPVHTLIAVVSVSDKDSGENGQVDIHISDDLPFALKESSDNYYELLVSEPLDREKVPEYDITITVTDRGNPPLSDNETITLELLDVNDNVPQFPQTFYTIPVMENNAPGALLSSLTAIDPDLHENQYLVYFIIEKEIVNTSMSMLFSINPENGNLYALKTFDYEIEKEFLFHIEARDSGVPPLSSNVTVHIIIMDQNDNTPLIVSPWRAHGSVVEEKIPRSTDKGTLIAKVIAIDSDSVHNSRIADSGVPPLSSNVTVHIIIMDQNDNKPLIVSPWRAHGSVVEEKIPRSTDKGTLIAKVIAIDSDSVHNSRIAYQFLHNTDATLFSLDQYNGEIRTMRMFSYRDSRHQQLVVIAKDNGEPALSATVTIKLSTVETALKTYADMTEVPLGYDIFSDLNLYLVIGLGSVSFLLLITILVTIVLKCQKTKPSKAAPPCRNSVISERNSTIADSTLVSNDAYWYSLFLAETRKGKLVVRQPVPKGARYVVSIYRGAQD
uniref:Si:ch73-233f7.3 n=1 Tax=Cyprinus carpio carpio TaxID=630221 RepID=A0A9J8CA47_CYPCA